jgi:hypothetical protein
LNDARGEIARLIVLEERTTVGFRTQLDLFTSGNITATVLAQTIDRTILPELVTAHARLSEIGRVPQNQQMLLTDAAEYLRLREESWRLRAEGLQKSSPATLRRADATEQTSRDVLRRIQSASAASL